MLQPQKNLYDTLHIQHYTVLTLLILMGCASVPMEQPLLPKTQALPVLNGSYHTVRRGETLWRIAHAYGLEPQAVVLANHLPQGGQLTVGQKLFIPLPQESSHFLWPVEGRHRSAGVSKGLHVSVPEGSLVRASRSGRVAVATRELSGWGNTIILDHLDGYLTVYAGLEQILIAPGASVRQGVPIGTVGSGGLHFEIRHGIHSQDALQLLPS